MILHEPIPVQPFLDWCDRREAEIRRELDAYPAISGRRSGGGGVERGAQFGMDPRGRLVMEIGWSVENGQRRLHRWRYENLSGQVERAEVEEALHYAGVPFDLIYPLEAESVKSVRVRLGENRLMSDSEVIAAHTVYHRARMSTTHLGELLYERFGYSTPSACAKALSVAFRGLGLEVRRCSATRADGGRCERTPADGSEHCLDHGDGHRPCEVAGRRSGMARTARAYRLPPELVARARHLHVEHGRTLREIARTLLPSTPLGSEDYLAQQLGAIAHREGWHRTAHLAGRKRVNVVDMEQVAA